ncbi:MAG TPA: NADH-quinone oxidoreductase subunit J [Chloroflexota bacterium]|nr:NADH-quinone oxidoreductase subunit J [Chloroflexota bacterium]HUM72497.1 NADH-quinone oxidoreductase subunit J [Chloroflexota bacterium]
MTGEQIVFLAVSGLTIVAGILVVTQRNLFHAALAMMVSFLGVAGIYITLEAGFLAAAQLLIYIGAISILIIFAIMLTRRMMQAQDTPFNSQVGAGLLTAVISFALLVFVITRLWRNEIFDSPPEVPTAIMDQIVVQLGADFVSPNAYVIPFIVASMLLLAALIGAIYVAWPQVEDEA